MLNLSAFNHNHHASRVKMVAKFIRRGIRVIIIRIKLQNVRKRYQPELAPMCLIRWVYQYSRFRYILRRLDINSGVLN